jgi:hypothetical protein
MNYNQIYDFRDRDARGAYNATEFTDIINDHVKVFKGDAVIHTAPKFEYHFGKNLYDLVAIGYASLYLLSDKVTNLLQEHQITGWKTYPAILYDKQGKEIEDYSIFSVTGRCGPIDWSKSKKFVKDPYVPGGSAADMLRGIYFDWDTWDGSDIFTAEGTLYTFVTQKIRDLLVKNKVTNILLNRITEIEMLAPSTIPAEENPEVIAFMKKLGLTP